MPPVASQFANRLSLIAFATVTVRGLLSGSDFQGTLQAALLSLGAFYVVGFVLGELARRVVEESVDAELAAQRAKMSPPSASQTTTPA